MIDKVELNNRIHEAAKLYLADIQQMSEKELKDNLRYFAEKCKGIAEGILENHVFANFTKYSEGPFAISDTETLSMFCDFKTGYQQQMLNWIAEHPLEVKEEVFELPQRPEDAIKNAPLSPAAILIGGTIVSVGLFIFTNIWIFIGAELLSVLLAKIQSNRVRKSDEQRKMAMEHYAVAIENKKNELVNGMIVELEKWLDIGEEESRRISSSYNL